MASSTSLLFPSLSFSLSHTFLSSTHTSCSAASLPLGINSTYAYLMCQSIQICRCLGTLYTFYNAAVRFLPPFPMISHAEPRCARQRCCCVVGQCARAGSDHSGSPAMERFARHWVPGYQLQGGSAVSIIHIGASRMLIHRLLNTSPVTPPEQLRVCRV